MTTRDVVIDACCMLNLLATRREVQIIRALELRLLDTPQTCGEPMFVWSPPDDEGKRSRSTTNADALREANLLTTRALDTAAMVEAFVEAAALIKDTDASCIAVAGTLGIPLVTDDRKERRIAIEHFPSIELISTLDLLHDAGHTLKWSRDELSRVAQSLRWGGNFAPPRKDPRAEWYAALLSTAGA